MDVLLVAAKRDLVEDKVQLLAQAGLEPEVVDVDAFALHNAFGVNHPEALQGVTALLNIGHELTNVNVLDDGVPLLTRDLTVGTRKIREDLQRERGVSADEADAMLKGFERSPDLEPYVKARGEEIAVGVERASAFLQTASRDSGSIQRVFCSGGGARVPGLTEILGQRLNTPVEVANPVQRVSVKEGVFDTVSVDEVAPLLMLATGLALRST
jgi:type IV pilus assembly protein PilM